MAKQTENSILVFLWDCPEAYPTSTETFRGKPKQNKSTHCEEIKPIREESILQHTQFSGPQTKTKGEWLSPSHGRRLVMILGGVMDLMCFILPKAQTWKDSNSSNR